MPIFCVSFQFSQRNLAPSFVGARPRDRPLALALARGTCCCSLEEESDRVEEEHDAHPPLFALDLLARLRKTVPHMRRRVHWPSPRYSPSKTSRPRRVLTLATSSPPDCAGTPLIRGRTVGRAVREPLGALPLACSRLRQLLRDDLPRPLLRPRAPREPGRLQDGGGQLSQFCRVDWRQSGQHVDQATNNISLGASVGHRLAHCPRALPLRGRLGLAFAPCRHLEDHA